MTAVALPWETWRTVFDVLRETGLPYMREHADLIEQQFEQHGSLRRP